MESNLVKLLKGDILARNPTKAEKQKEQKISNLIKNYNNDIETFLTSLSFIFTDI